MVYPFPLVQAPCTLPTAHGPVGSIRVIGKVARGQVVGQWQSEELEVLEEAAEEAPMGPTAAEQQQSQRSQ